ncbi:MAG: excinuclease ABC subunit UvrC [Proteobacteria bacterium]|nr:excinuclease ABC subunit UvrC [Desulfobulbaceae bacterium]MBU4153548.1 excinuclease ABC subunit UvrC [Pseudomonadota bacterium]
MSSEQPSKPRPILTPDFLRTVGHGPGVYLMKDAGGHVHYVGKARDLRRRLASYQRYLDGGRNKTSIMLGKTRLIEIILTATEKEALLLEASLIKQHKPKYNIILRDDKNYPYIMVTVKERWPRLVVTRRRVKDQAIFGPFSSPSAMWETIRHLNTLFPLRRCKGAELSVRSRPCLNHQMNRCLAPCHGNITQEAYRQMVDDLLLALAGKNKELIRRLKAEMLRASDSLDFEQAVILRDKIQALTKTMEKQVVVAGHGKDQDVFGFSRHGAVAAVAILLVRGGVVNGHHHFFLEEPFEDDTLVLTEVIERFYGTDHYVPGEILIGTEPESREVIEEWLADLAERRVVIKVPQRGDLVTLLAMANRNAEQVIVDHLTKEAAWSTMAARLKNVLHLDHIPDRIICMDISNLGGEQSVGAVVSFKQGKKAADEYRHYKIQTVAGPDDYASMAEVLRRHLRRAEAEDVMPGLLVVDGGKGQLKVAVEVVRELGLDGCLDLVGIAKEKDEEGEKLFVPGRKNPILLARHTPVLLLLMQIRDEAHRFGITFHRNWRGREALRSRLDLVPGIGPARKKALLTAFGSIGAIATATPEELSSIPGITLGLGQTILAILNESIINFPTDEVANE